MAMLMTKNQLINHQFWGTLVSTLSEAQDGLPAFDNADSQQSLGENGGPRIFTDLT